MLQPASTYRGAAIHPLKKGLPKQIQSLCPQCGGIVPATQFERDGRVFVTRDCPQCGCSSDLVSSDAAFFLKMEQWTFGDNRGLTNPNVLATGICPEQCGLCAKHTSHTGMGLVDLTNRCNLTCPVCFAGANGRGAPYEPGLDQVYTMLQALRHERPTPCRTVQFSGGEPTTHPQFHDAVRLAKDLGFTHIQVATNGLLFADLEFTCRARDAGLHMLYLQFDGGRDEIYTRTRGKALWSEKLKAIDNARRAGLDVVLVPTIAKGVNDGEVGNIVRFALANLDVVTGISFQPITFTGRVASNQRHAMRYTIADLARDIEQQTKLARADEDWLPLACTAPISRFISTIWGERMPCYTCHPQCSAGTYLFVSPDTKQAVPVTRFLDFWGMLSDLEFLSQTAAKTSFGLYRKVRAWHGIRRYFHEPSAPAGLTFARFLQTLQRMTDKEYASQESSGGRAHESYPTLMVAGMHFMDSYNYDLDRVQRCIVHYAAPNGLVYPFCTYNSGPTYRKQIEKKYAVGPLGRGSSSLEGELVSAPE